MTPFLLGGKPAPEPSIQNMPDAKSWHAQTILPPNPKSLMCLLRLPSSHLMISMWSLAKNSQWCIQQGKAQALLSTVCWEDGEPWMHVYPYTCVNSSLLQVMLVSVCSTLPRSFLWDRTWDFLHFDLIGQFKDSQISSSLLNQLKWLLISGYLKMLFFWSHVARSNWIRNLKCDVLQG